MTQGDSMRRIQRDIVSAMIISKDNKLSIIDSFDQIFTPKLPTRNPRMFLVGVIKGKADSVH